MTIRFRIPALAATAATGALLLTACSTTGTTPAQTKAGATKADDADPGTGHLHGLGVDPADGALYAAGHLGVFRLTPAGAVRVADRYQDTMGFAVTGPQTFLASGHPSPTDPTATSPHLGLIRSTDAAQTWTTVSAAGEADFHSSWTERGRLPEGARPTVLTAVSPTHLLAADTSDAVHESKDGGRTWTTVHRPDHATTGH
ncbi:hypothetical protein [Streptomyces subrutilus]|uniref:hypothetical protein n=1 Tax=Streptomyces subrutilus TaxID=36818 RepID=UPI0033C1EFD9